MKDRSLEKVYFVLDEDWHGHKTESLWAEHLISNTYKLKNIPFYAKNVSYDDTVEVKRVNDLIYFDKIIRRGGHSTYRIIIPPEKQENIFTKYWEPLNKLGCTYEKGEGNFYAIDIPAEANINECYRLLELGEQADIWEFEEGHCGHKIN
jgi:hypothetical protein